MYFHVEQQRYEQQQRLARAQVAHLRRAARAQRRLSRAERRVRDAREAAYAMSGSLRITAQ